MTITSRDGKFRYEPTSDDVLWLRRAVQAEGQPRVRVAQTLVNGFVFGRVRGILTRSLADYVRSYCQPVNPRWFRTGDRYRIAFELARTDEAKTALYQKAYEREYVHSTRTTFTAETHAAVQAALARGPDLPRATDFAAPYVRNELGELVLYTKPSPWLALTTPTQGQNRFWTRPGALDWVGYTVVTVWLGRPFVIAVSLYALYVVLSAPRGAKPPLKLE